MALARRLTKEQALDQRVARCVSDDPPDYEGAAAHIERALAAPDAEAHYDVAYWLAERADFLANASRYDDAIQAMERAIAAGLRSEPDGRARLAEFHRQAGRAEEAHELYAVVKAETPDDVWLYNSAGMAYGAEGDHSRALQWLTEGLELAMASGDRHRLVGQLADWRLESLQAMGMPADELQERADRFIVTQSVLRQAGFRDTDLPRIGQESVAVEGLPGDRPVVGWFPDEQFAMAVEQWPHLIDVWGADTYEGYCHEVQRALLRLQRTGMKASLAPIQVADFVAWCAAEGRDSAVSASRAAHVVELARRDSTLPWPPGRNEPCWCGSARKYKKCCGTVVLPLKDGE